MKKIFSVLLSVLLLTTCLVLPVGVSAADEASYEASTLGGYYKFTFTKDNIYNYAFGADATYKNNTFKPLQAQRNIGAKVGYKQITDSVTGAKYDTLEIVNGALLNFTPLTKEGKPYELTPGNDYKVKINLFNPVSNAWVHAFLCVGQENPTWANFIEIGDGVYNYASYPYSTSASFSNQGGMGWHYIIKDGTYGKTSTFGIYNGGNCLHTLDSKYEVSCSHGKKTSGSPYISAERTITLPMEHFEYDAVNNSYSAQKKVYKQEGNELVATGETIEVNNYLTFYFGGGNVSSYAKNAGVPLYGNASYSDIYDEDGNQKENYTVWQIESIEIWETEKVRVNYHFGDQVITDIGEVGTSVNLTSDKLPKDKYVIGWYSDAALTTPVTTAPVLKSGVVQNLYAKYLTYADGNLYNMKGVTQPTLKPFEFSDKTVTLNENGWAHKSYTAEGVVLGKGVAGNAFKWDPNKANDSSAHVQTGSASDLVAIEADKPLGEQFIGGWGASSNYVLRDKNGNPAIVRENTKYAVSITYKKLSEGSQSITIGAGRRADMVSVGSNEKSAAQYNRFTSSAHQLMGEAITGEYETQTFYLNVGAFSEGDVPVVSIHNSITGYVVERVEQDANGVKSYVSKNDGKTYYPYKIVSYPQIIIKEANIIEVESGNVAVTHKTYEKGVGFSAVLSDGKEGDVINTATKNPDPFWYFDKEGTKIANNYPVENTTVYNAGYFMAHHEELYPDTPVFSDGKNLTNVTLKEGEKEIYALKYSADKTVREADAQVMRLNTVKDGHTYKFTAKIKANTLSDSVIISLITASGSNVLNGKNVNLTKEITADTVTLSEWTTVTCYFTADPRGTVMDKEEYGYDYQLLNDYANLFIGFTQSNGAKNEILVSDIRVEDCGVVITAGGTSVLTDSVANSLGEQAIRYYFNYATENGDDIKIGSEAFKIVERGFIYKRGILGSGRTEAENFFATNKNLIHRRKKADFTDCWAYENGVLTYSTYVNEFKLNNDNRKLQIKGYLIIEDKDGNRHYIHSDSINRNIDGAKNGDPSKRRLIWSEEFGQSSIKELKSFHQKYDTMISTDSSLTLSTSEENYFIDPATGELVLRITSDGNRNYKTPKSVTTRGIMSYKYGYLEMRAKVPYQKCVWPSFWMQPDKSSWNKTEYTGEIDIFEVMGTNDTAVANLHKWYSSSGSCTSGSGNTHYLDGYNSPRYKFSSKEEANDYHVYGFEWNEEFMAFYIDGQIYCKIDITEETGDYCANYHAGMDCFHCYYYISLNNWLFTEQHSSWVNASNFVENNPDFGTVDYRIDYIRLYQNRYEEIYLY